MRSRLTLWAICLSMLVTLGCRRGTVAGGGPENPTEFSRCQGDSFRIDLQGALGAMPEDTSDAHLEQLRDWVWMTLLARIARHDATPELLAGLARQPLFRDDGLSDFMEQPVGLGRSVTGKDGTVYVLVQRSSPRRTYDDVLEAVDRESLLLGEIPKVVKVYGVQFHRQKAEAEVCWLSSVGRQWIEAPRQGFRHSRVTSAEGLERFLDGGVDLLSASCKIQGPGKGLELTGRVRPRTARAPITTQHVAALNQQPRFVPSKDLSIDPERIPPKLRENAQRMAAAIDQALKQARSAGHSPLLVGRDAASQNFLNTIFSWKRSHPQVSTVELVLSFDLQLADGSALGFSLDPRIDAGKAATLLDQAVAGATGPRASLASLRDQVRHAANSRQAEELLIQATQSDSNALRAKFLQQLTERARYQCARYDGPLRGTEAGMTMFYTDLLAKLWAMDWRHLAPTGAIPGFASIPERRISTVYCNSDQGVPHTRIWFGARREGYLREAPGALRFAPETTRLFAKGSALGSDFSEEVEPSADMLRFIRWWDRHYSDIAEWEPQYELLNQLVKWTLVRRMAEASGAPGCLAFLGRTQPEKTWRFDDWVEKQRGLRWKGPVKLLAKKTEPTECLNAFASGGYEACGGVKVLSGGVGLPTVQDVADRPVRSFEPEPFLRRVAPGRHAERLGDGSLAYSAIEVPKARIEENLEIRISPQSVDSAMVVKGDDLQRGNDGLHTLRSREEGETFRKQLVFEDEGRQLSGRQERNSFGVGQLRIGDIQSDKPHIEATPGPELLARRWGSEISERMGSGHEDLPTAARSTVDAELPVMASDDDQVVIRLASEGNAQATDSPMISIVRERGPPGSFYLAAADPVGREPVGVNLLRAEDARRYLSQHNTRLVIE
jgi:hypothetical protein